MRPLFFKFMNNISRPGAARDWGREVCGGRGGLCADRAAGLPGPGRPGLCLRLPGRPDERVGTEAQHRRHYRHRPGRGADEVGGGGCSSFVRYVLTEKIAWQYWYPVLRSRFIFYQFRFLPVLFFASSGSSSDCYLFLATTFPLTRKNQLFLRIHFLICW